jgi:hypothetical protein
MPIPEPVSEEPKVPCEQARYGSGAVPEGRGIGGRTRRNRPGLSRSGLPRPVSNPPKHGQTGLLEPQNGAAFPLGHVGNGTAGSRLRCPPEWMSHRAELLLRLDRGGRSARRPLPFTGPACIG